MVSQHISYIPVLPFVQQNGALRRDRRVRLAEEYVTNIVRVQSLVRGFLQRRKYRIMKLTCEV